MFRKLCGTSLKKVVILTTVWDEVTPEEGSQHEQELMASKDMFKPLLDGGPLRYVTQELPSLQTRLSIISLSALDYTLKGAGSNRSTALCPRSFRFTCFPLLRQWWCIVPALAH